jgi:hypothetical protein
VIELKTPLAVVALRWVPESDGGRVSGPPTAPVYAATAAFCPDATTHVGPDADLMSVLLQRTASLPDGTETANISFLAPALAEPLLTVGAPLLITEGPRVVAHATVQELLHPQAGS